MIRRLLSSAGSIVCSSHARDPHLVLGPRPDGKPVRCRVTVDGAQPGNSPGVDIAADGSGAVTTRGALPVDPAKRYDRRSLLRNDLPRSGVQAFAFTFGQAPELMHVHQA